MSLTTDRNDPKLKEGQKNETGQHDIYLVLSEEERAKGFVRPIRDTYVHIGRKVESEGEVISLEEAYKNNPGAKEYYNKNNGYGAFLKYPEEKSPLVGKYLRQAEFDAINSAKEFVGGCGTETKMGYALAETYARDPKFYGATFCCHCNRHLPVDEFIWKGTNETVGS